MFALETEFAHLATILLAAAVVGALATLLRQPLIVAFIIVGVVFGPAGFGWSELDSQLDLLATVGIAVLLFLVGLKLDLGVIRSMGPVALATGLGQVAFTSIVGFILCLAIGLSPTASIYVAIALTFSSTIIIVKLLSDKREIDSLHGRIAIGFLIVQDLVVIIVMIALSALGGGDGESAWRFGALVLVRGAALVAGVAIAMLWVLPRVSHVLARSTEMLTLFAIAWAVGLAALAEWLGFSKEVGAFLAGVSLAPTHYRDTIGGKLTSVRDFLLLFFFVKLGAGLELQNLAGQIAPALILSIFVLVGNPLIVLMIMGAMGYRRRTGFLAGLTVAQISEFSLIFAALGVSLGHIDESTLGLVTFVGIVTIGASTYMILYSGPLYERIGPLLKVFERRDPHRERAEENGLDSSFDVVIIGLGRFGTRLADRLESEGVRTLAVDFDPRIVLHWKREGRPAAYADAEDPEFPTVLPLTNVAWVVCTAPDVAVNRAVQHHLRRFGYGGRIALTAHTEHAARRLKELGADRVLLPFADAADRAVEALLADVSKREFGGPPKEGSS